MGRWKKVRKQEQSDTKGSLGSEKRSPTPPCNSGFGGMDLIVGGRKRLNRSRCCLFRQERISSQTFRIAVPDPVKVRFAVSLSLSPLLLHKYDPVICHVSDFQLRPLRMPRTPRRATTDVRTYPCSRQARLLPSSLV